MTDDATSSLPSVPETDIGRDETHDLSTEDRTEVEAYRQSFDEETEASEPVESRDDDDGEQPEQAAKRSNETKRRKRRKPRSDAKELRFRGRRARCKTIHDIAPRMLKTVKLRILNRHIDSTKGMDDRALEQYIVKNARKLCDKKHILSVLNTVDPDVDRRTLKHIMIFLVLLQEETHSLEENRLDEKVLEFEKNLVKRSKKLDLFDSKVHDANRAHAYDTYRIVLDAAWRNEDDISKDEASLLGVLRDRLSVSQEEHWLIGANLKRFPKAKCALHSRDEIHDARKELQREGILWNYTDGNNRKIDVIPSEIVSVIRRDVAKLDLQRTNYQRILEHDSIRLDDLRSILITRNMDRYGNKEELINRIAVSDLMPSDILSSLDGSKLSEMCLHVGLKSSGKKLDLVERLIDFYDDLSFEEPETQDQREEWYNNYELLAARAYNDLRAKKLITKDLQIEHQFEEATDFLFERKLNLKIDRTRKVTKADGRIPLSGRRVILWDCKSAESAVNLQDYLEDQFDRYLRKEREKGAEPLAILVIGPSFTASSIKLVSKYKAQTNWDVALVRASALKHLAEQWAATEADKPFPITLLNRTELIDKERVDFILSLA